MLAYHRDLVIISLLALIIGTVMAITIQHPGYTDAYYYFNAGQRLIQGKGLTDAALWTYISAPPGLPVPSHLYWMPLASLVAAGGMLIGGPTFDAAQLLFVPLYAGLVIVAFILGALLGHTRRTAWSVGLLTIFSGYFMPYWTTTSTFAPYALVGALALLTMGLGRKTRQWRWFALSGVLCGLAHLTRNDGVLLLLVLLIVALWPDSLSNLSLQRRWLVAVIGVVAYLVIMTPWFVRNQNVAGAILPPGGFQTAWLRSYDEIANYPLVIRLQDFIDWGPGNILASRWEAFGINLQHFVAVEGMVLLTPFMLIGLWKRRHDPLLSGFWLYAVGLHLAMTFVFPFPGERGGLFHSSSALVPFWSALGVLGLDDVIAWAAPRRRWPLKQARRIFGSTLVIWAVLFSIIIFTGKVRSFNSEGGFFRDLSAHLPPDAVVMINDPSALYYFIGLAGIVVPNEPPSIIPELAKRYGATYLVLDPGRTAPMNDLYEGREQVPFLELVYHDDKVHVQIYKIKPAP